LLLVLGMSYLNFRFDIHENTLLYHIIILELSVKLGRRQHPYPEFGHKQGEIQKTERQGETEKTINFHDGFLRFT
jgi:hypothetical protein